MINASLFMIQASRQTSTLNKLFEKYSIILKRLRMPDTTGTLSLTPWFYKLLIHHGNSITGGI